MTESFWGFWKRKLGGSSLGLDDLSFLVPNRSNHTDILSLPGEKKKVRITDRKKGFPSPSFLPS